MFAAQTVNGSWGEWGPWTVCSVTCGLGQMSRSRNCDNPKPDPQGQDCVGIGEETEACNLSPCPGQLNIRNFLLVLYYFLFTDYSVRCL